MLWTLIFCSCAVVASTKEYTVTKLPELVINSNVAYFERHRPTHLNCTVVTGWPGVRLTDVYWMKDGVPVTEIPELAKLYHAANATLSIGWTRFETEGDYQCSAMLKNIELGDGRVIDTRLVSAPVYFKRARLTKFDDYEEQMIRVTQEQLTRIPCHGLPDVVPSPAIMWFEKEGEDGVQLGLTSERRFVITSSGLQIALVQPSDAGNYYCVVKNPYTNHTRRAPKPTALVVNGRNFYGKDSEPPRNSLVFPLEGRSPRHPIVIHTSVGQTILLECVTSHSSVKWTKGSSDVSIFDMENPHRVYEKVWGNLRLRSVVALDSDIYVCHGTSPFAPQHSTASDAHSKVYYQLFVHLPTTAQLNLEEEWTDTWRLVCYAGQQFYEVPMVYMNGFPLIERSHILAEGQERVAETNPLNVTLKSTTLTGTSVQCMSRAAMVEAEVYGEGLERGDAVNFYVDVVREEIKNSEISPTVLIDYNATVIATLSTNELNQLPKPINGTDLLTTTAGTSQSESDSTFVSSALDKFLTLSPESSFGLKFVVFLVSSTFAFCLLMLFCCLGCFHLKEWHDQRFSKAAKGKYLDTSQRIFNEQLLQRSRAVQEQQIKLSDTIARTNSKTGNDSSISMLGHFETPSFYGSADGNDSHTDDLTDFTTSPKNLKTPSGFYRPNPNHELFLSEWHENPKSSKGDRLTMSSTLPHPFNNSQSSSREHVVYDSQSSHSGNNGISSFQSSSIRR